jgi:hypothetical protein
MIFISASIPDPERWVGDFDALEITDAVVALARACLTRGYGLVTAANPTIAPLLLYVAAELSPDDRGEVRVYQSLLFEDVLPTATRRFEADGVGKVVWTEAVDGELPEPGRWDQSLRLMREQMLEETEPVAAVFIGGMEGISAEFELFANRFSGRPTYAAGRPGGEARNLVERSPEQLQDRLSESGAYPALWWAVLDDLNQQRSASGVGHTDLRRPTRNAAS